jgi:hypothetical protein
MEKYTLFSSKWDTQIPIILEKILHSINVTNLINADSSNEDLLKIKKIKTYYDRLYIQGQSNILKSSDPFLHEIIKVNLSVCLFIIQNLIFLIKQANTVILSSLEYSNQINNFELYSRILYNLQNMDSILFNDYIPNTSNSFITHIPPEENILNITIPDPYSSLSSSSVIWKVISRKNTQHPKEIKLLWKRTNEELFIKMLDPIISKPFISYIQNDNLQSLLPFEIIKFKQNSTYMFKIPSNEKFNETSNFLNKYFFEVDIKFENLNLDTNDIQSIQIYENKLFQSSKDPLHDIKRFAISIESYTDGLEFIINPTIIPSTHKFSPLYFYNKINNTEDNENDEYLFPSFTTDASGFYSIHNVLFHDTLLPDTSTYICTVVFNINTLYSEKIDSLCILPSNFKIIQVSSEINSDFIDIVYIGLKPYNSNIIDTSLDTPTIRFKCISQNDMFFLNNDKNIVLVHNSKIYRSVEPTLLRYISTGIIPSGFIKNRFTLVGFNNPSLFFETFSISDTSNSYLPLSNLWGGFKIAFAKCYLNNEIKNEDINCAKNSIKNNETILSFFETLEDFVIDKQKNNNLIIANHHEFFKHFLT